MNSSSAVVTFAIAAVLLMAFYGVWVWAMWIALTRGDDRIARFGRRVLGGTRAHEECVKPGTVIRREIMLQVEVQASCLHVIVKNIDSVLESPKVGDSITCPRCQKERTVAKVTVPSRLPDEGDIPTDPNQKSLF